MKKVNPLRTPEAIQKAVDRMLAGDSLAEVMRDMKATRSAVYFWVRRYKQEQLLKLQQTPIKAGQALGMSKRELRQRTREQLLASVEALRDENRKLRELVMSQALAKAL